MTILVALAVILCLFGAAFGGSVSESPSTPVKLFVFGDSLADAGNNNYIPNTTSRANFPPYGETFFHRPTGRFSNGRTVFDFIATRLRIRFPPPFLQPGADFSHGVNFASGGSGLLDSTGKDMTVIPLSQQIKHFAKFSRGITNKHGSEAAKSILSKPVYAISVGGNDFGLNYLVNPTFQNTTSPQDFVKLLLSKYNEYLRSLYGSGARNFIIIDIAAVGCTPNSRLAGFSTWKGECLETANRLVAAYNAGLAKLLNDLNSNLKDATFLSVHSYNFFLNMIHHGQSYGFSETRSACCGSGPFNTAVSCGKKIPAEKLGKYKAFLCKNPDKYLFWDGTHPTERVYRMISSKIWGEILLSSHPTIYRLSYAK